MKNALVGAAILLVGILIGHAFKRAPDAEPSSVSSKAPAEESAEARKLRELREKLAAFSEHDLEDYVRLKNLEEKYKKADELVGKMILILLADVGLKVSMEQEKFARSPKGELPPRSVPSPLASKAPVRRPQVDFAERRLRDPRLENPERYLRDVKIDDFNGALSRSTVPAADASSLNGCFDGQTHLSNGRDWAFHFVINVSPRDANLYGYSIFTITENGKTLTKWEHEGQQETIRRVPGSLGYILEASSSVYLQLYETTGGEALVGNVYTKDAPGQFSYKGTTALARVACGG